MKITYTLTNDLRKNWAWFSNGKDLCNMGSVNLCVPYVKKLFPKVKDGSVIEVTVSTIRQRHAGERSFVFHNVAGFCGVKLRNRRIRSLRETANTVQLALKLRHGQRIFVKVNNKLTSR